MYYCHAKGLAVGYEGKPVLKDVEIGVERGELLTLIGPNGAGKSTLLKSLAGQLALLGGTVLLDGEELTALSGGERARKLALMLPHPRIPELMTCREVVSAGRYPYTGRLGILSAADREKVEDALALAGASHLAEREFDKISDGQRQRVLLARAVCQEPEMILLDEPTSFLDIRGKIELLDILHRLAQERGVAVVASLHELDLAQKVSDRVVCVSERGIFAAGTPEQVFTAENIRTLYAMTAGSYDPACGSVELTAPAGAPQVFVIGGAGRGIPLYRKLQRMGVPFGAGILYENDLDTPVAAALAAKVVTQKPFEPFGEAQYREARVLMLSCREVWCAPQSEAAGNEPNRRLRAEAEALGKLREPSKTEA